jgi:hypothetical protein
MVEMGLVVARVAGFISGVRPAGGTGERGPPQGPSSPASNLPGNALSGAGSPGGGFEPLPAVLALILVAAALRRRYWPTYEHRCEAEAGSPTNTRAARLILLALGMLRVPRPSMDRARPILIFRAGRAGPLIRRNLYENVKPQTGSSRR